MVVFEIDYVTIFDRPNTMHIQEKQETELTIKPFDNQLRRSKQIHPNLPSHPFSLMVCGPKGGGKSTLILRLLFGNRKCKKSKSTHHKFYRHFFQTCYVFSPTWSLDTKCGICKIPEDQIFDDPSTYEEAIQEIMDSQAEDIEEDGEAEPILMVFTDLAGTKMFSHNRSILNRLALNSRHYSISLIIDSQQSKLINTAFRTNLSGLIMFASCLNNKLEYKKLREEYLGQYTDKQAKQIIKYVFKESPFNFLFINFQKHGRLFKNFNPLKITIDDE